MTTTTHRIRPAIDMTIPDAVHVIRSAWARYKASENSPSRQPTNRQAHFRFSHHDLQERIRDCGWCIGHAHGYDGLRQLHDQSIKSLLWESEGYYLSRQIDNAFAGICGWMV